VTRRPAKKTKPRTPKKRAAKKKPARARTAPGVPLGEPQLRWLDSVAESIAATGGPTFTRTDILHALVDANSARTLDPRSVRSVESLRVAFGAMDMSKVEQQLRDRPKLEASLLDALKDTIK
jgi:hypothetical protein